MSKRKESRPLRGREILGRLDCRTNPAEAPEAARDATLACYQVFAGSGVAWLLLQAETGQIVQANPAACRFYGYSAEELQQMTIFQLSPTAAPGLQKHLSAVKRLNHPLSFQHHLPNGELREVQLYANVIRCDEALFLSTLMIDVTGPRQELSILERSCDRLKVVLEASKAGIWEWDITEQKLLLDERCQEVLGYANPTFLDSFAQWQALCHPDDIAEIMKAAQDYLAGLKDAFAVECRLRHQNGSYRWIRSTAKLMHDKARHSRRWVGSYVDVTAVKEMERLQQEQEERMRHFAYNISDYSFIVDEDGRYIEAFVGVTQQGVFAEDDFRGKTLFEVMEYEDALQCLAEIRMTITAQQPQTFKRIFATTRGMRTMLIRTAPLEYTVQGKRAVTVAMLEAGEQEESLLLLQAMYQLRQRSEMMNELVCGTDPLAPETTLYLKSLGIEWQAGVFCCAVKLEAAAQANPCTPCTDVLEAIIHLTHGTQQAIAWQCREGVALLGQAADRRPETALALAQALQTKIQTAYPQLQVLIGVGEIREGRSGAAKSFRQAWEACRVPQSYQTQIAGIMQFRELGLFQVLMSQSLQERSKEFVENVLGDLIRYDADKSADYVDTLEVLLQTASAKEAAQRLYLHHNTIMFRKRRIEEILAVSLNDFETKLNLAAAIKLYRLQQ